MSGLDLVKQTGKNIIGMIEKAQIEIEDQRVNTIKVVEVTKGTGENATTAFDASLSNNISLGRYGLDELSELRKEVMNSPQFGSNKKIKRYTVRFNPSTLSISAYGGGRVAKTSFDGNEAKTEYGPMNATITLNVQLIFDNQMNHDSFMNSGVGLDTISDLYTGDRNSVQKQVEGFIAALRSPYTRRIRFSWGKLSYAGVLTDVDAEYTMFSIHGRPVRAVVNIGISCTDPNISANHMGQWKNSFDKAFSSDKTNLESPTQNVSNLLNLNF